MPRTRTFIAVAASSEIRNSARRVAARLKSAGDDIKWVSPENLHWTLHFLGDVDDLEIPAFCDAVSTAVTRVEPFTLTAYGVGAFPSLERPRIVWLGASTGSQAMGALHSEMERELQQLGYRGERRDFVPHLTLGRAGRHSAKRSLAREIAALADFDGGSMVVDEVHVYASTPTATGPCYDVLARTPLGSGPSTYLT